jgi:hypothetical protein
MIRGILKTIAWCLGIVLLLVIAILAPVDHSDFRQEDYYLETINSIQNFNLTGSEGNHWLVGWSTANITPSEPGSLVGYKPRGEYEFIQDSSYVKALVISNGDHTMAILSYELLIIHPYLANEIEQAIANENLPLDKVIFTATHTHSGLGGYIPGIMGKVAFGGFEEEIISLFRQQTIHGLKEALASMDTATITYRKVAAPEGVSNRLIEDGPIDPYIRQLVFEKKDSKAIFYTYSAHATGLHSRFMGLSGDYPFYLNRSLTDAGYDFALFASGAVGSHRPEVPGREVEDIQDYARQLSGTINNEVPEKEENLQVRLQTAYLPMTLPSPTYRISDHIRLRPWVFHAVFGNTPAHFDVALIGNTLLLTSSGEISGVFYEEWEQQAAAHGLNLIITTFNGGYIGYITPDEHYDMRHHEVRDTHWFGPHIGSYYKDLVRDLIFRVAEEK